METGNHIAAFSNKPLKKDNSDSFQFFFISFKMNYFK